MIVKLLWVFGILAAIAILIRGSVLMGLYLGVLPGLVLAAAPTIFLYLAAFAVIRRLLPFSSGFAANLWAAVAVFALGVAIALPMALAGRAAFAAAATGDVVPGQPVKIAGHVTLERLGRINPGHGRNSHNSLNTEAPPCDALCAALLDTPGVLSVTLSGSDFTGKPFASVTYRLVPKSQAPGETLAPLKPEEIVGQLPEPDRQVLVRSPNGRAYLDVRWRRWRVVVEIDGIGHLRPDRWIEDSLRHNEIALSGDVVLRVPSLGLRLDPRRHLDVVERALRQAGWTPRA